MYRSLHPRADVDRLYWMRKNGEKGLISVEECVKIEKNKFRFLPEGTRTTTTNDVKTQLLNQCKENMFTAECTLHL